MSKHDAHLGWVGEGWSSEDDRADGSAIRVSPQEEPLASDQEFLVN